MSVLTCGYWCLGEGQRLRPNERKNIFFNYYNSALGLQEGSIPCEIRVYSPYQDIMLPLHTIVFLFGRIAFPRQSSPLIDAIEVVPAPGDANSVDYQDTQIAYPFPLFFLTGTVTRVIDQLEAGERGFVLTTTEYVRDGSHVFQLGCAFVLFYDS